MIYDSFTITVLATLENLGFCKRGEGGAFVSGGRLRFDGEFPINTDGGGLSSNHPGMRGIFLVIEATKQLRGECGPRQVKDCKIALAHGTGGSARHAAFGRDAHLEQSVRAEPVGNIMAEQKAKKYAKPLPHLDEENRPWWEAMKRHELYIQKCRDAATSATIRARYAPTACRRRPNGFECSGRGKVYTFTTTYQNQAPRISRVAALHHGVRRVGRGPENAHQHCRLPAGTG